MTCVYFYRNGMEAFVFFNAFTIANKNFINQFDKMNFIFYEGLSESKARWAICFSLRLFIMLLLAPGFDCAISSFVSRIKSSKFSVQRGKSILSNK